MARTGMSKGRPAAVVTALAPGNRIIPKVPEGLKEAGTQFWDHTFTHAHWLDSDTDFFIVYSAAKVIDDIAIARSEIDKFGRYQKLPNGVVARSAAAIDLEHLLISMNSYLAALGLTPTDRARLGIVVKQQDDVFAELARRRIERGNASSSNKKATY